MTLKRTGWMMLFLIFGLCLSACGVDVGLGRMPEPEVAAVEDVTVVAQPAQLEQATLTDIVPTQVPTSPPPPTPIAVVEADAPDDTNGTIDPTSEVEPTPISYLTQDGTDALTALEEVADFYGVNLVGSAQSEDSETDGEVAWGDAYCPFGTGICVRPLAVEFEGETAIVVTEAFGVNDTPFYPENSNVSWRVELYSKSDEQYGNTCRNTFDRLSGYQKGFGHLSLTCVDLDLLDQEPLGVQIEFQGSTRGVARFPIGDPLPRTDNVTLVGKPLELGKPYFMNVFEVTINQVEELEDMVILDVTVTNLTDRKQGIEHPNWVLIGQTLNFYGVDESGYYKEWMEPYLNIRETVGGMVNPEETVTGAVILEKGSDNWQLVMKYGRSVNAVYQILDPPAPGTGAAVDEG